MVNRHNPNPTGSRTGPHGWRRRRGGGRGVGVSGPVIGRTLPRVTVLRGHSPGTGRPDGTGNGGTGSVCREKET